MSRRRSNFGRDMRYVERALIWSAIMRFNRLVKIKRKRVKVVHWSHRGIFYWMGLPFRIAALPFKAIELATRPLVWLGNSIISLRPQQAEDLIFAPPIRYKQPPAPPTPTAMRGAVRILTTKTMGLRKSEAEALVNQAYASDPRLVDEVKLAMAALRLRKVHGLQTP